MRKNLKKGDIFVSGMNYNFINKFGTPYSIQEKKVNKEARFFNYTKNFSYEEIREATPEQKHWLNSCIEKDTFITYEEAMKTFIPEYVECIKQFIGSKYKLGMIYKVSDTGRILNNNDSWGIYKYNQHSQYRFKPSTKEAYDAQFIVKEPEFVLPEKWCLKVTRDNVKFINNVRDRSCFPYTYITSQLITPNVKNSWWSHTRAKYEGFIEITFEQFKKYILKEQLEEPKDKVLTTLQNRIIEVESSEGAIYQLNDKITVFTKDSSNKGKIFTIKGFRWNNTKTNLCAITEIHTPNGIGLDKIELYSEPIIKELSLLEQAKLRYPVGTKFKSAVSGHIFTIKNHNVEKALNPNTIIFKTTVQNENGGFYACVHYKDQWAEIIEDFKLPKTWWVIIENEKQLEIANHYFNQIFKNLRPFRVGTTFGYVNNTFGVKNWYELTETTKSLNPQITFEQFKQYVLPNVFKE